MATALFRIDVATLVAGVSDVSRNDGEPNLLVTLTYTGVGAASFLYRFWDYQGDFTVPTIVNATTSVATFTPNGGANAWGQTFGIELLVDGSVSRRRVYRIPTFRQRFLLAAFVEAADRDGSLYNAGASVIEASTDNANSNYRGWSQNQNAINKQIEKLAGLLQLSFTPHSVESTVETLLCSRYIPAGNLNKFEALMGSQSASDTAELKMYRQTDDVLISTLSRTGLLGIATNTNVTIAQSGWYNFRGRSTSASGIAVFRGGELDLR